MRATLRYLIVLALSLFAFAQAQAADAIPGIGPTGPVTKVDGVYQFTEGPAADAQGNVYFSDIPANRIYKIDPQGKVALFLEPSGHTNGLMLLGSGEIGACQMDGQVVAISADDQSIRPLAKEYNGARFNAPNDLVIDRAGGVYFTDPHFRAPDPLPQGKTAV